MHSTIARPASEPLPSRRPLKVSSLAARETRQVEISAGGTFDFLPGTREIRDDPAWRVAAPAPGLVDRRVEITGPTERKMTVNALNSGANVWLADFEDANTPLWENMITGQLNLRDALDRTIDFTSEEGKSYRLLPDEELATIVVRPRGWHLDEKHVLVDGRRMSGSLALQTVTLQAVGEGIGAFDRELRLIAWNPTYVQMCQLPAEWLRVGLPLAETRVLLKSAGYLLA